MRIEKFSAADIPAAAALTKKIWGDELPKAGNKLQNTIYESMVRYYSRNEHYSLKVSEHNSLQGFLLAALPDDSADDGWLQRRLKFLPPREQRLAAGYHGYLAYNGRKLRQQLRQGDLLLCLFVSCRPGGGSMLLQQLEKTALRHGLTGMTLWADATCDCAYYQKHGFTTLTRFVNEHLPLLGRQETAIYHKTLIKNRTFLK